MVMLSGCHKLPDHKMNCETTPDNLLYARSNSMAPNAFAGILRNFHLCDNKQLDK